MTPRFPDLYQPHSTPKAKVAPRQLIELPKHLQIAQVELDKLRADKATAELYNAGLADKKAPLWPKKR